MPTTKKQTTTPTVVSSSSGDLSYTDENGCPIAKGGVACPFPWRLHECLDAVERDGLEHICSWQSHGRSFTVYKPREFEKLVMPRFFGQTRYASFQRQLNIYGFHRFQQGRDKGAYYHLAFVRGNRNLVRTMKRTKIKGVKGMKTAMIHHNADLDFYDPAWKNHLLPSVPKALQPKTEDEETPAIASSPVISTNPTPAVSLPVVPSQSCDSRVGSNIVIPFGNASDLATMLLKNPALQSNMGILASFQPVMLAGGALNHGSVVTTKPAEPVDVANFSTVSDDHSDGLSSKEDNSNLAVEDMPDDFSILSFTKDLFEEEQVNSCNNKAPAPTSNNSYWEDLLAPTPVREPCQCCGGTGMKLVDPNKNIYSL